MFGRGPSYVRTEGGKSGCLIQADLLVAAVEHALHRRLGAVVLHLLARVHHGIVTQQRDGAANGQRRVRQSRQVLELRIAE